MPVSWSDVCPGDRDQIVELKRDHPRMSWKEVAEKLEIEEFTTACQRRARDHVAKALSVETNGEEVDYPREMLVRVLRDNPCTLKSLSLRFDRSEPTLLDWVHRLEGENYNVVRTAREIEVSTTARPPATPVTETIMDLDGGWLNVAFASDWHFGSRYEQPTNLRAFIDRAYDEGVREIFAPGDVLAGTRLYRGQSADLYVSEAADQIQALCTRVPRKEGLRYWIIGGSHDYVYIRHGGPDPLKHVSMLRPDIIHLGYDAADVPLTENMHLRMWHPTGGVPYARSYRLQKGMEAFVYAEMQRAVRHQDNPKLGIVAAGHLHILTSCSVGVIEGFQVGCFEGQSGYLRGRGLFPEIGGYILRMKVTPGGRVLESWAGRFLMDEIKDDWLNYPMPTREENKIEPVFEIPAQQVIA